MFSFRDQSESKQESVSKKVYLDVPYDEKNEARELERLKKMAKLTHRETIDQYNNYLASLSEHHDVPKVGNAGMG